ncbi:MAG: acetyl-CoA acyltransferase [Ilumatobacteraceae bacterium]|jgi:acetyl-CoA acetyltransferase family protein
MQKNRDRGHEVVIVGAVRTAIGRGHAEKGWMRNMHPAALLGECFTAVLDRAGVEPSDVDDVIAGCVHQFGPQAYNVARNAWLQTGLPLETPATMVDRACGSAQQAVNFAAASIAAGINDIAIGAGVEMMSHVSFGEANETQATYGAAFTPELLEQYEFVGQGEGAELIADDWALTRDDLDTFAAHSHAKAAAATAAGAFDREIVEVTGAEGPVTRDQGIRPDTNTAALARLPTVFRPEEKGGRITAGSSSQISDGAAAVLLASRERAEELGLPIRARIIDHVAVGVDPVKMLEGPIPATHRILDRNGIEIDTIDRLECNEAFAPVVLAWQRAVGVDPDRVNVRGGAIALGHPVGSTGARLLTTLLHTLEDDDAQRGLVTMCCGGGLGTATLIERTA